VPPVITSSQNAITYASTFLSAGVQAVQSIQQGADPMEVLKFLSICGPAIHAHLQRFADDPTRKTAFDAMQQQWEQLARVTDQLQKQAGQMQKAKAAQQAKSQGAMTDDQLKTVQTMSDIRRRDAKAAAQMRIQEARARQGMVLADASTAAEIHRSSLKAFNE
jgi:hypothetical protein